MPFAEAFKTLFEPVRPTFTLSRSKEMLGRLPRQSLSVETVRAATKGQTRRMGQFEKQLRAVTRRGAK